MMFRFYKEGDGCVIWSDKGGHEYIVDSTDSIHSVAIGDDGECVLVICPSSFKLKELDLNSNMFDGSTFVLSAQLKNVEDEKEKVKDRISYYQEMVDKCKEQLRELEDN